SGRRASEELLGLDVPTLLGVWEGGPYLHDGSAPTLMDVVTSRNSANRHGNTSHVSQLEKEQLVAFLSQLDQGNGAPSPAAPRGGAQLTLSFKRLSGGYMVRYDRPLPQSHLTVYDLTGKSVVS